MKFILIRHAEKDIKAAGKDPDWSLSNEGSDQAVERGKSLARLNLAPDIYLTSSHKHAQQTAEIIEQEIGSVFVRQSKPGFHTLDALTPDTKTDDFEVLLDQADLAGLDLHQYDTIAIVGHEAEVKPAADKIDLETRTAVHQAHRNSLPISRFIANFSTRQR